jgi:hypothetical protein
MDGVTQGYAGLRRGSALGYSIAPLPGLVANAYGLRRVTQASAELRRGLSYCAPAGAARPEGPR